MMRQGLFAACGLLLAACAGTPHGEIPLTGYWIERMPANPGLIQGVRLDPDGGAASIGMHTLRYTGWQRLEGRLLLTGQSIGNGQTLGFTDTLDIVRLSTDSLILGKDGRYRIEYVRATPGAADGIALLDSLRPPMPECVLEVRIYAGQLPFGGVDVPCELTLFRYEHSGDGVFRLTANPASEHPTRCFGRVYTLRGDAADPNATLLQLRAFPESEGEVRNFRRGVDCLELLDEHFVDRGCRLSRCDKALSAD